MPRSMLLTTGLKCMGQLEPEICRGVSPSAYTFVVISKEERERERLRKRTGANSKEKQRKENKQK